MLDSEQRRSIVLAAIQGLCANPEVMRGGGNAADIVQTALKIAFELERQAPAHTGIGE